MPTYRYRCINDHTFEVFTSMTAPAEEWCPQCWEEDEILVPVLREIGPGAAVLWKGGAPTPHFGR